MQGTLAITGNADADELLNTDPLALLLGMLLDQQVRERRARAHRRRATMRRWAGRGGCEAVRRLASSGASRRRTAA